MNVRECPVGDQKAIYGSICHVPVDVANSKQPTM